MAYLEDRIRRSVEISRVTPKPICKMHLPEVLFMELRCLFRLGMTRFNPDEFLGEIYFMTRKEAETNHVLYCLNIDRWNVFQFSCAGYLARLLFVQPEPPQE